MNSVLDSEHDPDIRDATVMKEIEEYYKTLEKIYVIHIKRSEIELSRKTIRPAYLAKFYMIIEKRIKELLYENSELQPSQIPKFKIEVKRYFQKEYFHNSHFFLSLLYRENLSIINIIKECANRAIRYEVHFDKYLALNESLVSNSNQNHSKFMIEAKKLIDWVDEKVEHFEEGYLRKVTFDHLKPGNAEAKEVGGFFANLFSRKKSVEPSSQQGEGEEGQGEGDDLKDLESVWRTPSSKEAAFLSKVKNDGKKMAPKIAGLLENDLALRDGIAYELESNYLKGLLENSNFEKFKRKTQPTKFLSTHFIFLQNLKFHQLKADLSNKIGSKIRNNQQIRA